LDYVDLYLMHWPVAQDPNGPKFGDVFENIPIIDTWREIEVNIYDFYYKNNFLIFIY